MSILQVLFLYGCGVKNQPADNSAKEPGYTDNTEEYDLAANDVSDDAINNAFSDGENTTQNDISNYEEVYYLYSLNTTTLEKDAVRLYFHVKEGMGESEMTAVNELVQVLEEGNASIADLDAAEGKLYLFATVLDQEDNGLIHYYALRTDGEDRIVCG